MLRNRIQSKSKIAGFGMVEALVAAGFVALLAMGMAEMQSQQMKSMNSSRTLASRDSVVNILDKYSLSSGIFQASAAYSGANNLGNLGFSYCYNGSPTTGPACAPDCCQATTIATPQPFNMVDPSDPTGLQLLAGTDSSSAYPGQSTIQAPALFDGFGNPCKTPGPNCGIEIVANYIADCGGAPTCSRANVLSVTYTVRQSHKVDMLGQTTLKPVTQKVFNIPLPSGISTGNGGALVTSIGSGFKHSCALVNGGVQCWGTNYVGQLGQPSTVSWSATPLAVSGLTSGVQALSVSYDGNCAIVSDSTVWCWGNNQFGILGNGNYGVIDYSPVQVRDTSGNPLQNVQSVAVGVTHSCAISNGAAYCWGSGQQAGLGNIDSPTVLFNSPYSDGALFATPVMNLTSGVTAISVGLWHTCAIQNGALYCWGYNDEWGLTLVGSDPPLGAGTKVCWPYDTVSPHSKCVPLPTLVPGFSSGVQAVATADVTTCALMNGGVQCWGYGWGELGNGGTVGSNTPVPVTGLFPTGGVTALGANETVICATVNGGLQCWGQNWNNSGVTGDGSGQPFILTPTPVVGMNTGVIQPAISTSLETNCGITNGKAYCWGTNDFGQLGNGTTTNSIIPVPVSAWQ